MELGEGQERESLYSPPFQPWSLLKGCEQPKEQVKRWHIASLGEDLGRNAEEGSFT